MEGWLLLESWAEAKAFEHDLVQVLEFELTVQIDDGGGLLWAPRILQGLED